MENENDVQLKVNVPASDVPAVLGAAKPQSFFKDNIKHVIVSICIGAAVTMISTIFEELAKYLRSHTTEVVSAMASAGTYLASKYRG
jgi:hypothetical protein